MIASASPPATRGGAAAALRHGIDVPRASTRAARTSAIADVVDRVFCVGVSHQTAPIALRERLYLAPPRVTDLLLQFATQRHDAEVGRTGELVVLSTCNRLELYSLGQLTEDAVVELIVDATGVTIAELAPALYHSRGADAVRHLARVAAGLESMVLGEPQILGQVADAYAAARAHGAAAHGLETLFRSAVHAGRRVRNETAIGRQAATVSSLAVRIAAAVIPDLAAASTLVIGTGEMGEHALAALHHRGIRDLCVVSRTHEHAERLASRFGGRTATIDRLTEALGEADIVVCAAAAPRPLVTQPMVALAMVARQARPLLLLDVGVPRNVEPEAGTIPLVRYYDLDDLHAAAAQAREARSAELPCAEAIIVAEAERCVAESRRLEVQPLVTEWRAEIDGIRDALLEKTFHRCEHLGSDERARLEAFSKALVNRLLHTPMARLRAAAEHGQSAGYALAVRHLFALDE